MKEIICNITQQTTGRVVVVSGLDEEFTKNNVLGIINKTQSKVLYTPVQATNMLSASYQDGTITISLADNVPNINKGDELLVKLYSDKDIDFSTLAKEQTLLDKAEEIKQAVENGGGSGLLEEFWDVVPEDSEEIISEEDIHAAVEDIWTQTFNS